MKKLLRSKKRTALLCSLFVLFLSLVLGFGFLLPRNTRKAYAAEYTVGELMLPAYTTSVGAKVNKTNLNTLFQKITNNSTETYDSLKSTLSGTRNWANNQAGKAITNVPNYKTSREINGNAPLYVTFGGIEWAVVYVTTTGNDGNGDLIATLMMKTAPSTKSYWASGSAPTVGYSGQTITNSANHKYYYNEYSSSYIRMVALNAGDPMGGDTYYSNFTGGNSTDGCASLNATVSGSTRQSHTYAKFTLTNATNSLTQYIVQPKQVRYQEIESWAYTDYIQTNHTSTTNYNLHNEAWGITTQSWGHITSYDHWYTANYTTATYTKDYANDWTNDYLWLPSLTEVGCTKNKTLPAQSGVWCTQDAVRNHTEYHSRTGGCGGSYTDFLTLTPEWFNGITTNKEALVRPCLHLNLTELNKATEDVEFKDVEKVYNGDYQDITKEGWYKANIHGNTAVISSYTPQTVREANEEGYTITFTLASGKTWSDGTKDDKTILYKVTKRPATVAFNKSGGGIPTVDFSGGIADKDKDNPPGLILTYYKIEGGVETELSEAPSTVGNYKVSVALDPASPISENYKIKANESDADPSTTFTILKQTVTTPTVAGGKSVVYTGDDIEFVLQNDGAIDSKKIKELTDGDMPAGATYKKEDDGTRKIIVHDVGTYKVTFTLADGNETEWGEGGGTLTLTVTPKPLTVTPARESGSWQFEANSEEKFTLTHDGSEKDTIEYVITYTKPDGEEVTVGSNMISKEGNVTTVTLNGLSMGAHTLNVKLADASASNSNKNYTLSLPVSRVITVNGKTVSLDDSDIVWELTELKKVPLTDNMTVTYTGRIFTASIDTANLSSKGVRVKEYTNQTSQNVSKVTTTVTLTKLDDSYMFEDRTYTIHWEIIKAKYDLSKAEWSDAVLEYNGNTQRVKLNNVPSGLTVSYTFDSGRDVKKYTATVRFTNTNSANYEDPKKDDASTYIYKEGESFPWTLDWEITQAVINLNWDYTAGAQPSVDPEFYYPKLILTDGDSKVGYKFYEDDGTTEIKLEDIVVSEGEVKVYYVEVYLLEAAKQNYKLAAGDPKEIFTIGSDKTPVTITPSGTLKDGVYSIGEYDGTAKEVGFTFKYSATEQSLSKSNFSLEYYDESGAKLDGAPKDAGNYTVRFTLTGEDALETYYIHGKTAFDFTIERKTILVSDIDWDYTEAFVYTRSGGSSVQFKVKLKGLPDELVTLGAVAYTGNEDFSVAKYHAIATLDTSKAVNYLFVSPAPEAEDSETELKWELDWEIKKRELKLPVSDKSARTFDGAEHDLIELCGLEADYNEYLTVSVKKDSKDYDGTIYKDAGQYTLLCTIKGEVSGSVIWEDGNTLPKSGFINVSPRRIVVTGWQYKPSKPVFADDNSATLCEVVYTLMDDDSPVEVSESEFADFVKGHYGEKFRATLRAKDGMEGNIEFKWEGDVSSYDEFIVFDPTEQAQKVSKPTIKKDKLPFIESTDQMFDIEGFNSKYMKVLGYTNISQALTMGDVGKRTVKIALRGDVNVEWRDDGDESFDGIVKLTIEITPAEITGTWAYDPTTKLPIFTGDYADFVEVVYFDRYGNEVDPIDLTPNGSYNARARIKSSKIDNYCFAADLADSEAEEEGLSKPKLFVFGVVPDDEEDPSGSVEKPDPNTNKLPLWQLIVSGVCILLFLVCAAKSYGNIGKAKAAKKETKELAMQSYVSGYAFAPLPLLAIGLWGLGETPWTIIACVAIGLFVISLATMLITSKKRKAAELSLKREQARVAEEKEMARIEREEMLREEQRREMREEQARRDNEMKMMFAAMQQQQGFGQPQMNYEAIQGMIMSSMQALLPALQQQMALPPAESDPSAYVQPQPDYAARAENEELRAQLAAQREQMAQQQQLLNQILQNQQAQSSEPYYEEPADDTSWLGENSETVSLEESYGNLDDNGKRAYYDIGSYIMGKPRTSQNDGRYAVLFKYRGRTVFKLAIKDDAPVLYYPSGGGRAEVRVSDAQSLEVAKAVIDRTVMNVDSQM